MMWPHSLHPDTSLYLTLLAAYPPPFSHSVPFSFGVRVHGESKLTGKVIINYLSQLWELYQYKMPGVLPIFLLSIVLLVCYVAFLLYSKLLR
jgi:dolichol-phosphate mannosyltransferase